MRAASDRADRGGWREEHAEGGRTVGGRAETITPTETKGGRAVLLTAAGFRTVVLAIVGG